MEIVLPLGFADATFRREKSDDRKCVCCSQAGVNCSAEISPKFRLKTVDISIIFIILLIIIIFVVVIIIIIIIIAMNRPCTILVILHFL